MNRVERREEYLTRLINDKVEKKLQSDLDFINSSNSDMKKVDHKYIKKNVNGVIFCVVIINYVDALERKLQRHQAFVVNKFRVVYSESNLAYADIDTLEKEEKLINTLISKFKYIVKELNNILNS